MHLDLTAGGNLSLSQPLCTPCRAPRQSQVSSGALPRRDPGAGGCFLLVPPSVLLGFTFFPFVLWFVWVFFALAS